MFSRVPLKTLCCSSLCGGSQSQPLAGWMGLTPTGSEGEGPTSCFLKVTVSVYLPLGKKINCFFVLEAELKEPVWLQEARGKPSFCTTLN